MSPSADHILREDGITADLSLFLDAVCSIYVYCLALSDETNISKKGISLLHNIQFEDTTKICLIETNVSLKIEVQNMDMLILLALKKWRDL